MRVKPFQRPSMGDRLDTVHVSQLAASAAAWPCCGMSFPVLAAR